MKMIGVVCFLIVVFFFGGGFVSGVAEVNENAVCEGQIRTTRGWPYNNRGLVTFCDVDPNVVGESEGGCCGNFGWAGEPEVFRYSQDGYQRSAYHQDFSTKCLRSDTLKCCVGKSKVAEDINVFCPREERCAVSKKWDFSEDGRNYEEKVLGVKCCNYDVGILRSFEFSAIPNRHQVLTMVEEKKSCCPLSRPFAVPAYEKIKTSYNEYQNDEKMKFYYKLYYFDFADDMYFMGPIDPNVQKKVCAKNTRRYKCAECKVDSKGRASFADSVYDLWRFRATLSSGSSPFVKGSSRDWVDFSGNLVNMGCCHGKPYNTKLETCCGNECSDTFCDAEKECCCDNDGDGVNDGCCEKGPFCEMGWKDVIEVGVKGVSYMDENNDSIVSGDHLVLAHSKSSSYGRLYEGGAVSVLGTEEKSSFLTVSVRLDYYEGSSRISTRIEYDGPNEEESDKEYSYNSPCAHIISGDYVLKGPGGKSIKVSLVTQPCSLNCERDEDCEPRGPCNVCNSEGKCIFNKTEANGSCTYCKGDSSQKVPVKDGLVCDYSNEKDGFCDSGVCVPPKSVCERIFGVGGYSFCGGENPNNPDNCCNAAAGEHCCSLEEDASPVCCREDQQCSSFSIHIPFIVNEKGNTCSDTRCKDGWEGPCSADNPIKTSICCPPGRKCGSQHLGLPACVRDSCNAPEWDKCGDNCCDSEKEECVALSDDKKVTGCVPKCVEGQSKCHYATGDEDRDRLFLCCDSGEECIHDKSGSARCVKSKILKDGGSSKNSGITGNVVYMNLEDLGNLEYPRMIFVDEPGYYVLRDRSFVSEEGLGYRVNFTGNSGQHFFVDDHSLGGNDLYFYSFEKLDECIVSNDSFYTEGNLTVEEVQIKCPVASEESYIEILASLTEPLNRKQNFFREVIESWKKKSSGKKDLRELLKVLKSELGLD